MKNFFISISLLFIEVTCGYAQNSGGAIPVFNFKQFEYLLHKNNDTVYLINFWATWCKPCREEIPAIERVGSKYQSQKFKVILVSLDFPNQLSTGLPSFIQKNGIRSKVIMLDDPKQNEWIDKIDKHWAGDIPFTVIYGPGFREFYATSFSYNTLDSIINLKFSKP